MDSTDNDAIDTKLITGLFSNMCGEPRGETLLQELNNRFEQCFTQAFNALLQWQHAFALTPLQLGTKTPAKPRSTAA